MLGSEAVRVLFSGADALVLPGEAANGDGVGEDLAVDGRAIAILERELVSEVFGSAALRRVVCGVA